MPSLEQQHQLAASRMQNDAELLSGGATLHATPDQIEAARREMTEAKAGQVVLHDTLEIEASRTADDIIAAEDHREQVMEPIRAHCDSYASMFADKVPLVSEGDKTVFGKLKDRVELQPWSTVRQLDTQQATYEFGGEYTPGEHTNSLSEIDMKISNIGEKNRRRPAAEMHLGINNGAVTSISARFAERDRLPLSGPVPAETTSGNLTRFLNQTSIAYFNPDQPYTYRTVSGGELLVTCNANEISLSGKSDATRREFKYVYSPGEEDMRMEGVNKSRSLPNSITTEQFTGIVTDLLGMIPTMPALQTDTTQR